MDRQVEHYGNHGNRCDVCVSTVSFVVVVVVVVVVDGGGGGCYREPASHRQGYTGRWHATIHNAKQGGQKGRKKKRAWEKKKQKKTRGEKLITITNKEIYTENQFAVFPREVERHKAPITMNQ